MSFLFCRNVLYAHSHFAFMPVLRSPGPSASHPWTVQKNMLCMFLQLVPWMWSLRRYWKKKKKNLKDHQIGMGLKNNLIEALSSCTIPTLYIFSHQKYTLLRQPFLSIMSNSAQKHFHAVYQKLVSLSLHTHPMVWIPGCVSHLIPISPAFTTNITEKQD